MVAESWTLTSPAIDGGVIPNRSKGNVVDPAISIWFADRRAVSGMVTVCVVPWMVSAPVASTLIVPPPVAFDGSESGRVSLNVAVGYVVRRHENVSANDAPCQRGRQDASVLSDPRVLPPGVGKRAGIHCLPRGGGVQEQRLSGFRPG